jgi:hypothetical protein
MEEEKPIKIDAALEVVQSLGAIGENIFSAAPGGINLSDIKYLWPILKEVKDIVDAGPRALPQLRDLDKKEAALLTEQVYESFALLYVAFKGARR